jgi:hypothetical protein
VFSVGQKLDWRARGMVRDVEMNRKLTVNKTEQCRRMRIEPYQTVYRPEGTTGDVDLV